jgi:hypothetical protein
MRFSIFRFNPDRDEKPYMQDYEIALEPTDRMLLDVMLRLKSQDDSLSFRRSCREGICGSDAMNINGRNGLACITPMRELTEPVLLRPLPSFPVIRDLVVDMTQFFKQYHGDTLPAALEDAGIGYVHVAGLGGFRRTGPESVNQGWRNASFRGYADYMQTAEFAQNLASLLDLAKHERVALMCAEAVPWRCHRSLIADALVVHGLHVEEINSLTRSQTHVLTSFARVDGMAITYPHLDTTAPGDADSGK